MISYITLSKTLKKMVTFNYCEQQHGYQITILSLLVDNVYLLN